MKKYGYVDITKLFFAVMIVLLHSNALEVNNIVIRIIQHGICQIGVPFFFVAAGFFFEQKVKVNGIDYLKKYVKRLLIPFTFWLILNYPLKPYSYYKFGLFKTILLTLRDLLFYPWGAMWYILALIVAVSICYIFYRKNRLNHLFFISIFLYLFALLCNNYYFVISNTFLKGIIDAYLKIAVSARNGIFEGILFVSAGMLISMNRDSITKIKNKYIIFSNLFLYSILILEILFLNSYDYKDDGSLFASYILLVPALFCILIRFETTFDSVKIRNYSSGIYFSHRFILGCLSLLPLLFKIKIPNYLLFVLTIFISFAVLKLLYFVNNKYINKVIK